MSLKIQPLFPDQPALGHYVRVGATGYQQLEHLLESGRLTVDRAVFDAGLLRRQAGLLAALRDNGAELVLDTNVAELSTPRHFDGSLSQAPWAVAKRPLQVNDFQGLAGLERISSIARFAVENRFNTVLSPTHLVKSTHDLGIRVDIESAEKLRAALDAEGGRDITIDFPLILATGTLRDTALADTLIKPLADLPIENVWIRASGFGSNATGIGIVRYVRALREFLPLSRPIVADGIAGIPGAAALAFGAASAISHGVGVHETFNATEWSKPRARGGGGQPHRVLINALDRQIKMDQLQAIVATPYGRRRVACNVPRCCPNGLDDMLRDPKAHYCYQRRMAVDALTQVPYARRADDFVGRVVRQAADDARLLAKLRLTDVETRKIVMESKDRIERIFEVLSHFHAENDLTRHTPAIRDRRGKPRNIAGGEN